MSTKTDFTPEEWETIRNAPYLAAAAVMIAGRSGIFGSIKEGARSHFSGQLLKREGEQN
jgi:hypothetical protein